MTAKAFVRESNKIEGIIRPPTEDELAAHDRLLRLDKITVGDMEAFVKLVQPDAILRRSVGLNVRVGSHVPPPGGPDIERSLENLLSNTDGRHPFGVHCEYEALHPFTGGNGRSGRALWLWAMNRKREGPRARTLGFLHTWYYQTWEQNVNRTSNTGWECPRCRVFHSPDTTRCTVISFARFGSTTSLWT